MSNELPTIPWLNAHPSVKLKSFRDLGDGRLEFTATGNDSRERHAFAVQMTSGRTAIVRKGETLHVGSAGIAGQEFGNTVTVVVAVTGV